MKTPYPGLSLVELDEIKKGMGMQQGHWYECQNGHPYVIGECGGAVTEARCHCGAQIGTFCLFINSCWSYYSL